MKKVFLFLIVFLLYPLHMVFGDAMFIGSLAYQSTAAPSGSANILSEDFDGATTCLTSYTCDNAWTAAGGSTLNADATAPALTGFSGQCATLTTTGWSEAFGTMTFTSQNDLYARIVVSISAMADASAPGVLSLSESTCTTTAIDLIFKRNATVYTMALKVGGVDAGTPYTVSLNTPYLVELYANNTTDAWEWRIDGVVQGSGTQAIANDMGCVKIGGYGGDLDIDIDNVALDDTSWIGAP